MNYYIISLYNSKGAMNNYGIIAASRAIAEDAACDLAGVPRGSEPHTSQLAGKIDKIVS